MLSKPNRRFGKQMDFKLGYKLHIRAVFSKLFLSLNKDVTNFWVFSKLSLIQNYQIQNPFLNLSSFWYYKYDSICMISFHPFQFLNPFVCKTYSLSSLRQDFQVFLSRNKRNCRNSPNHEFSDIAFFERLIGAMVELFWDSN